VSADSQRPVPIVKPCGVEDKRIIRTRQTEFTRRLLFRAAPESRKAQRIQGGITMKSKKADKSSPDYGRRNLFAGIRASLSAMSERYELSYATSTTAPT
jgi:hypothetical protein